jgi:hypothetical protein
MNKVNTGETVLTQLTFNAWEQAIIEDVNNSRSHSRPTAQTVKGQAYVCYRIIRTPLEELYGNSVNVSDLYDARYKYDFFTVFLNLTIMMEEPMRTYLNFARFIFTLDEPAEVLKIAPSEQGIEGWIKESGERSISITPYLDIGPGLRMTKASSQDNNNTEKPYSSDTNIKFIAGVNAGIGGVLDARNGWTFEFPYTLKTITGSMLDKQKIAWEIYGQHSDRVTETKMGKMISIKTAMIIKVPRGINVNVHIKVNGQVVKEKSKCLIFDIHGPVKLHGEKAFELKAEGQY